MSAATERPAEPPRSVRIEFWLIRRDGTNVTGGAEVDDLAAWTEAAYRRRVRLLQAWPKGGDRNEPIASIVRHPDTNRRVWWAEAAR